MRLTANMWATLGVTPIVGRVFGDETESAGRDREVVLGYEMWKRRYAGDSTAIGRQVLLDGDSYTIAVSFLLIAACANLAHMLLARSSSRQREMAVRIAIGASGARLARQLLSESLLLSCAGGLLGLVIATTGKKVLIALAGNTIPRSENIQISFVVLLVTMLVSVVTGLLFGLAPARNAMRTELVSSLKDGGRTERAGSANAGFRDVLVASQFAIALTLLIGAGLMMRTLAAIHDANPGFDALGVMTAEVSVNGTPSSAAGNRLQFYQQLIDKVSNAPGVQSVSAINHLPLAGDIWGLGVLIEGAVAAAPNERKSAVYRVVLPGYFRAMGIKLTAGHVVTLNDRLNSEPVVVVNEQFVGRYWPNQSAIGKRFALNGEAGKPPRWMTVVGVSHNTVRSNWLEQPEPEMYLP